MRQVTSWWVCVVLSVVRSGRKFLTPLWRVSIIFPTSTYCFLSFVLFVFQQSLLLTLMIFLSLPNLARTLAVHRIRWCFEPLGASRTEAIPCFSSVGQHQWQKWWREQYRWAPATITFQENVQNEESLGDEWCWAILSDWAHRCCDKTQSFLLQNLSQGRVLADSWSPRDFAALPGQQTLSARPTSEVGDARLGTAGLWGERHESTRSRAPAREDNEGSFRCDREIDNLLKQNYTELVSFFMIKWAFYCLIIVWIYIRHKR